MFQCSCEIEKCALCSRHDHHPLDEASRCTLTTLLRTRHYAAGEILFSEGDPSDQLFILRSGQVKMVHYSATGREQIVGLAAPGYMLGFHGLHDAQHPYSGMALSDATVCVLKHRHLLKLLKEETEIAEQLIETLNTELEQSRNLLRAINQKTAAGKVAAFILSLVPRVPEIRRTVPLLLSRLEIAEMLGLSEETVSRVMAKLRRGGLIEAPRGEITILDADGLCAVVENGAKTAN